MDAAKERLAAGYSRSALAYDVLAGHSYLIGLRRLLPLVRIPPGAAILDVGSGTGINLLEAARWFWPARLLCGIDISPGMVQTARAKAALMGIPAQFALGDAEKLPYPDNTFDLVICNSVLHWFRNRPAAVREMARVLRPGGQLVLICAASPGFQEWFTLMDSLMPLLGRQPISPIMPKLPTALELQSLLQGAGLQINLLANPTLRQRIFQPEAFVRYMSTVAPPWAADLSPLEMAAVEQLAAAAVRRAFGGGFSNTWSALEAVATKPG